MKRTSLQTMLKDDFHMFPCKIQVVHNIGDVDKRSRMVFGETFLRMTEDDGRIIERLIVSD